MERQLHAVQRTRERFRFLAVANDQGRYVKLLVIQQAVQLIRRRRFVVRMAGRA
ncbi:MAG: hypothetical protein IIA23_09745 [Chloroflexi bacterium]|nr:hypothetical protein [Chloroflexota bacterium]